MSVTDPYPSPFKGFAIRVRQTYEALIEEGFSEEEALELTKTAIANPEQG